MPNTHHRPPSSLYYRLALATISRRHLLVLLLSVFAGLIFATPSLATTVNQSSQFTVFLPEDGLNIGQIEAIYQDHEGFIWIGGFDGLVRYDGYEFEFFASRANETNSLSHNIVRDIIEDQKKRLWVATHEGLNVYNRNMNNFDSYIFPVLNKSFLRSMALDGQGQLWLGTRRGLTIFNTETREFEYLEDRHPNFRATRQMYVLDLKIDTQGIIWAGTASHGLLRINPAANTYEAYTQRQEDESSIGKGSVWAIEAEDEDSMWVGTDGGLSLFNKTAGQFTHYTTPDSTGLINTTAVAVVDIKKEKNTGDIWMATPAGLHILEPASMEITRLYHDPTESRTLSNSGIKSIYFDSNDDIWVGTFPNGLNYFNRNDSAFSTVRHKPNDDSGLNNSSVLTLAEDGKSRLWVGTDGGGLNLFDPNKQKPQYFTTGEITEFTPEKAISNAILDIVVNQHDDLWVGSWSTGIGKLDTENLSLKLYKPRGKDDVDVASDHIWSILIDSQHRLWCSELDRGVYRFNPDDQSFKKYAHPSDNIHPESVETVWTLVEDSERRVWAGTDKGLNYFDEEKEIFVRFPVSPDHYHTINTNTVLTIHEDEQGYLWLGTRGGGLNRLDKKTGAVKHFGSDQGLLNQLIVSIEQDNLGFLWLGTHGGLVRFDRQKEHFLTFDTSNGIQGNQFNFNASTKLRNGDLIFGGTKGFTKFDPDNIQVNSYKPRVVFRALHVLNENISPKDGSEVLEQHINNTKNLVLNYNQSIFSIQYSGLSYRNPESNRYAYILEGFDNKWQYVENKRLATYMNLSPGRYTFKVKAANNAGVWSEPPKSIDIRILPPIWRTWWAYLFYFVFILLLVIGSFLIVRKKRLFIEEQNKLLEEKIHERTTELVKKEKLAALGSLVAGVAHELNTPIGNGLTVASTMLDTTKRIISKMDTGIKRSDLDSYLEEMRDGSNLVCNSLSKASELVSSFKQVAMDRTSTQRRTFKLSEFLYEIQTTMTPLLRQSPVKLNININVEVLLDSYPGPLGQVITNLIDNAILHGFDNHARSGQINLSATRDNADVVIKVSDNGRGINSAALPHIFDPFFTTKLGEGGSGLGLHIVHNIVTAALGGSIEVSSEEDGGTEFILRLPHVAPEQDIGPDTMRTREL